MSSYGANAAFYKLPDDSVNDIQPIITIGEAGYVVALHPAVPIKSIRELIAYAKANPGKLNFGSSGTGSLGHLSVELFKLAGKVDLTHIPYKSYGQALTDLISGEIELLFGTLVGIIPHAKSGRVRVIGVTTAKRSGVPPDLPTVGETVAGYEAVSWFGLWGPKGLPKDIVTRWNKEVEKVLLTNEMKSRMARSGVEAAGGSPAQFLNAIRRDVEKWKRVVKEAKITVEG